MSNTIEQLEIALKIEPEWIPLGPEDVSPGSAITADLNGGWDIVTGVQETGVSRCEYGGEVRVTFDDLYQKYKIKRPGEDWQPCRKEKK